MKKIKLIIILCSLLSLNINNKYNNNITKVEASELGTSNQIVENNNNFNISFNDIEYPLYVEELDYVELMTLDDINAFNNWILSFNVNHNSKENILFVRNNLNKLILKAIKLNVIRDIFINKNARFSGDTHSLILTHAIEIFEYDGKFEVTNFYVNYLDTLSKGVKSPDYDDEEAFDGTHYYIYDEYEVNNGYYKNKYNTGGKYSISARTRFEEHYTASINLYKNKKIRQSMDELGRALHYLQDVASAPHSLGITQIKGIGDEAILANGHKLYENWVYENYVYNSIYKTTTAVDVYNQVLNLDNPGEILNDIARFSATVGEELCDEELPQINPDNALYKVIASACLPYAQKMTAAMLNRFYQDVTSNTRNPQYLKDGAVYYIKNLANNKYIDVKSWSTDNNTVTHTYDFTGDTNQQFRAELQDDGSYRFTPMHAFDKKFHISETVGSYYDLNITSVGHKFKLAYQIDDSYRIVPEYDNDVAINNSPTEKYYKYPIVQSGTSIVVNTSTVWEPSNNNYLWKFEEAPFVYPGETSIYLGKNQKDKVIINVPTAGYYAIETIGSLDTYFENLISRTGTGNTTTTSVVSTSSDNDGTNRNAKYTNVYMEPSKTYILTLRCFTGYSGNTTLKISGNTPDYIQANAEIRLLNVYTIDDSGRFNNSYDIVNISSIYGQTISSLISQGYKKIRVKISIDICEVDDGYQYMWIYDGSGSSANILWTQEIEHKVGEQDSNYRTYIFNDAIIDLSQINSNIIYMRYGASGSGSDTWKNKNLKLDFVAY